MADSTEVVRVKREKLSEEQAGAEATSKKLGVLEPQNEPVVRVSTVRSFGFVSFHVAVGNDKEYIIIGENSKRNSLMIRNLSADTVWIGEASITAGNNGNAWPIRQNEVVVFTCSYGAIFGRTEAGTSIIAVLEE